MRCFLSIVGALAALMTALATAGQAQGPAYHLGRTASADEVKAWDISVGPAGKELPAGSGTAQQGARIFAQKCAVCHGPTGAEGPSLPNRWPYTDGTRSVPPLLGGKGTLASPNPVKTIGSFWPYATTIWDYLNRAMPPKAEGTLQPDEVYALTALLLFWNGIIRENDVMDARSLPKVQMPNRDGFIPAKPERWWKPGIPPGTP